MLLRLIIVLINIIVFLSPNFFVKIYFDGILVWCWLWRLGCWRLGLWNVDGVAELYVEATVGYFYGIAGFVDYCEVESSGYDSVWEI